MRAPSLNFATLDREPAGDARSGPGSGTRWQLPSSARRTPTEEMSVEHAEIAGTAVFIPPNAWPVTATSGSGPMRFLFIFSAVGFEEIRYEFAADA